MLVTLDTLTFSGADGDPVCTCTRRYTCIYVCVMHYQYMYRHVRTCIHMYLNMYTCTCVCTIKLLVKYL